jgi:hypothetical protein
MATTRPGAIRSRLNVATLGGIVAIAAAASGFVSQLQNSGPLSNTTGLTLLMVGAAGLVAVLWPRQVETLAFADVLVGLALIVEMFGRLGMLYMPAMVLLLIGTTRARDELEPAEPVSQPVVTQRAMLASEFDRLRRAG